MIEVTFESTYNNSRTRVTLPTLPPIGSTVLIGGYPVRVEHYRFTAGEEEITAQTELNINLNRLE